MVNLHRWLKRTSPHLVIAGSLVITGLSGCAAFHTRRLNWKLLRWNPPTQLR